jgi:Flp pilus assembly protein TadB
MSRQQYSTRLPEDQAKDLERYCDERNVSKSEALRRSVEQLTEQDGSETDTEPYWRLAMVSGIVLLYLTETGILAGVSAVLASLIPVTFLAFWVRNR